MFKIYSVLCVIALGAMQETKKPKTFQDLIQDTHQCMVTSLLDYAPVESRQKLITTVTSSSSSDQHETAYIATAIYEGPDAGKIINLKFVQQERKRKYNSESES